MFCGVGLKPIAMKQNAQISHELTLNLGETNLETATPIYASMPHHEHTWAFYVMA